MATVLPRRNGCRRARHSQGEENYGYQDYGGDYGHEPYYDGYGHDQYYGDYGHDQHGYAVGLL